MDFPPQIPTPLRQFLTENYPPLTNFEKLGGMSGSGVWQAIFGNKSVVLKKSRRPLESDFYKNIAPVLRQQGVAIPAVYWQGMSEDGAYWLALESVPAPLPRERWGADPEILKILGNLHRARFPAQPDITGLYQPGWNDAMTANALKMLDLDPAQLGPVLKVWQTKAQLLFRPTHSISADPNPGNWGLREDGGAVLFDWERFTYGSPAIDVAIITTGLPSREKLHHSAAKYLEVNPNTLEKSLEDFAEEVKIAKVWVTLEFIYDFATRPDNGIPESTIGWLRAEMPGWLESLV
ncbi:MAG: aminoglycoside phosphotransferase family protein [Chloroflexi bacterium]|nr:aminoglycoside phosphotransferase family protein [Chloroflexota bacterium]OJV89229.1 MAG: hypothetical protein BGO39_35105 [Chloroflexi bacterium 54-19]